MGSRLYRPTQLRYGTVWVNDDSHSHATTELAQAVVDVGAVPLLILCEQEPEISLKRIAASSLSDIAKHSPELAQVRVCVVCMCESVCVV